MEPQTDQANAPQSRRPVWQILLLALGMGMMFDLLFFDKLPGISFPIYAMLTSGAIMLSAHLQGRELPRTALYMVPPLLFFSSMVAVRASEFVTFLNVVASMYLIGMLMALAARPQLSSYTLGDYGWLPFQLAGQVLHKARTILRSAVAERQFVRRHQALPQVVRGVLIALPVLLIFGLLFASADLVFRQYATDLFSWQIDAELVWRVILILLVSAGFVGLLGSVGQLKKPRLLTGQAKAGQGSGLIEASILFGSLNALFLLFILIQLAYLFGGEHAVLGGDYAYADYARRGFFELLWVAGLASALVLVADHKLRRRADRHNLLFKVLAGGLVVEVLVVMASALKRMVLYEGAYGFTLSRFYAHLFIIWLAVMLVVLLYKIVSDRREQVLALALFGSALITLGVINIMNVDSFVARQNIAHYEATGKLDAYYLRELSADAVPDVTRLLDAKDPKVQTDAAKALRYRWQQLRLDDSGHWQSTHLGRDRALHLLETKSSQLGKPTPEDVYYAD